MSASASAYTLALSSNSGTDGGPGPPGSAFLSKGSGLAEAQSLEHGPRLQGNGLVGRHSLRSLPSPEGTLLGAQQEFGW